jgi:hypothetical protein
MSEKNERLSIDFERSSLIKDKLGSDNVYDIQSMDDGGIAITVKKSFSRSNLKSLGIDEPETLHRVRGRTILENIIEIPRDRLPSELKPK